MSLRTSRSPGVSIICVALFLLCGIAATAQSTVPVSAAELAADARLQRSLTLDEIGVPLNELLKKVSSSEVALTAGRSCADTRLQIRLQKRPLHLLLNSLADLLPGYWEPLGDKSGFRLNMDANAISRREKWRHLFEQERERAMAVQRAAILAKMQAPPVPIRPSEPGEEYSDPAVEARIEAERGFFRRLPASLQKQIAYMPTDCSLYTAGDASFGTADEEGAFTVALDSLSPDVRRMAQERAAAIFSTGNFSFNFDNAIVNFTNGGFVVYANVITSDGHDTGTAFSLRVGVAPNAASLLLDQKLLAMTVKQMGSKAPLVWRQLAAYQESRVWKNDPPAKSDRVHHYYRRDEELTRLGEKAAIEFVADWYSHPGHLMPPEAKKQPLSSSLKAELDFQAAENDLSWKKRADNIYLFRNNRWYRDDYLEVPLPLLKRWYALRREQREKRGEALTIGEKMKEQMDWEAEVVASLSPRQISTGLRAFTPASLFPKEAGGKDAGEQGSATFPAALSLLEAYPFRRDATLIMWHLNAARFYAGLDSAARSAVIAGRLPFSALNSRQQEQAMYLVPRLRATVLQRGDRPILLRLKPKSEAGFIESGGDVRLTFSAGG